MNLRRAVLAKLEKRIEANTKAAWRENGLIMLHIRNTGLYKDKYGTFEDYMRIRWECSQSKGHRIMSSAEFMHKLTYCTEKDSAKTMPIGIVSAIKLPQNKGQVRPLLTCLNPIPFNGLENKTKK